MAGNGENVSVGPGWIFVAPIATALPTSNEVALPVDWVAVGYTEDGSESSYNVTSADIEVAEEIDPIATQETKADTKFVFSMAEMTRRNLGLALGLGVVANDDTVISPASLGGRVYFRMVWQSLDLVSPAVADTANVRWVFPKVFSTGGFKLPNKKAPAKKLLPVEFSCYRTSSAIPPFLVYPNAAFKIG